MNRNICRLFARIQLARFKLMNGHWYQVKYSKRGWVTVFDYGLVSFDDYWGPGMMQEANLGGWLKWC